MRIRRQVKVSPNGQVLPLPDNDERPPEVDIANSSPWAALYMGYPMKVSLLDPVDYPTELDRLAAKLRMAARWRSGALNPGDVPLASITADEPIPERVTYYNPHIDPDGGHVCDKNNPCPLGGELLKPTDEHPANLVSSRIKGPEDIHAPVLDIDIPMQVVLSPSGNAHLYFPGLRISWEKYVKLLVALAEAEIISPNWMAACARDGKTFVRAPGTTKFNVNGAGISEL